MRYYPDSIGLNKAEALKNAIEGVFYGDKKSIHVDIVKESAVDVLQRNKDLLSRSFLDNRCHCIFNDVELSCSN
jgi:hypothetical protein